MGFLWPFPVRDYFWDSVDSSGNRGTPLVHGTMFAQSINRREQQSNELEDTSSSRSSFADLWDSSIPIEIRDDSVRRGGAHNPTSVGLHMCNRQVMAPYFFLLSAIGWRPLFRNTRWFCRVINCLYMLIILMLLLFSYVSSIVACQARFLTIINPTESTVYTPIHPNRTTTKLPTKSPNMTSNISTSTTPSVTVSDLPVHNITFKMYTMKPAIPDWRPTECTHVFSGYIVPNLLHFIAFILGLYHFRIQESEGLQALIEMVFLQSRNQTKVAKRLRSFLIVGAICLTISSGVYILFLYSFGLSSVTGFRNNIKRQWVACCFMVLGNLVMDCITFVIILNFCAQCQLLIFYVQDIALGMEEKTPSLDTIMKNIWDVKKYVSSMNGIAAQITTMIVFNYCELTVLGLCILAMEPKNVPIDQIIYRAIVPVLCFFTLSCPIIMGTLLTSTGQRLKQLSLHIRVFGYPSTTQFDRDSFLLFVQHTEIKPKFFGVPLQASYVCILLTAVVFIVLLLMQTNILAGNNRYL